MSMIGCFYAVKDADLEAIIKTPTRIHSLWGSPAGIPLQKPSFLSRLFGIKASPAAARADDWQPSEEPIEFDVDKAWQGIHFLLTGSDSGGEGPLAFILHGGREINEDLGYGAPHGFTSAEVKEIDAALRKVDEKALYEKADPAEFTKNDIYPEIWDTEDKEDSIGYVTDNLRDLKKFISETAQANRALIAYLG